MGFGDGENPYRVEESIVEIKKRFEKWRAEGDSP